MEGGGRYRSSCRGAKIRLSSADKTAGRSRDLLRVVVGAISPAKEERSCCCYIVCNGAD